MVFRTFWRKSVEENHIYYLVKLNSQYKLEQYIVDVTYVKFFWKMEKSTLRAKFGTLK